MSKVQPTCNYFNRVGELSYYTFKLIKTKYFLKRIALDFFIWPELIIFIL